MYLYEEKVHHVALNLTGVSYEKGMGGKLWSAL